MTEKEYRNYPAISRSQLWKLRESPEKFRYYEDNPPPPTPALLFGQVVHKLLLQPEDFGSEFAVAPDVDKRTKEGREIYKEFLEHENAAAKTIVPPDQYALAVEMVSKALSEPYVKKLLAGEHEKPYFWTDELTQEPCKCRVDAITEINGKLRIVDYKTTSKATYDDFQRDMLKYGYPMQAAMYCEGVKLSTGRDVSFVFVAQEKEPPYSLNIFGVDEPTAKYGYDLFRECIGIYHYCKTTNDWYGYLGKDRIINTLSLPAWLAKEIE